MSNPAKLTAEARKAEIETADLFNPEALKAFVSKTWDWVRNYECTNAPFARATENPNPEKYEQIALSELGTAQHLWTENGGQVWGWM